MTLVFPCILHKSRCGRGQAGGDGGRRRSDAARGRGKVERMRGSGRGQEATSGSSAAAAATVSGWRVSCRDSCCRGSCRSCCGFSGSGCGQIGGAEVALEEEGNAGEGPQAGGLVVGRQLSLPFVPPVLEPNLDLEKKFGTNEGLNYVMATITHLRF